MNTDKPIYALFAPVPGNLNGAGAHQALGARVMTSSNLDHFPAERERRAQYDREHRDLALQHIELAKGYLPNERAYTEKTERERAMFYGLRASMWASAPVVRVS